MRCIMVQWCSGVKGEISDFVAFRNLLVLEWFSIHIRPRNLATLTSVPQSARRGVEAGLQRFIGMNLLGSTEYP